jgi:hypothetical protein
MSETARLSSVTRAFIAACFAASSLFLCGDVSAVTLTATYDSWIRAVDASDVNLRDNDLISVASDSSGYNARWGVVEFDLSIVGVAITEAHLQLWHQPNGSGDDCCWISQTATLINGAWANPAGGGSAGVGLLNWAGTMSAEGNGTTLTQMGDLNVSAATGSGDYVTTTASAGDLTALNADRLGDKLSTFLLIADEGGDNRNSWGDDSTVRARLLINEGPPPSDQLELRINRFSGATRIFNTGGIGDVDLDKYRLQTFPTVPEDIWLPGSWNSLADQAVPGWVETSATLQVLEEDNAASFTTIPVGGSLSLGNAYDVTQGTSFVGFSYSTDSFSGDLNSSVVFDGDGLKLHVNKLTGSITLINPETAPINFDGYSILSPDNELNATGWSSLADQSEPGWQESNPTPDSLTEINISSGTSLAGSGTFDLGAAYGGNVNSSNNLTFSFSLTGGGVFNGIVEYTDGNVSLGDFNGDGFINTADYVILRNNWLSDGNGLNQNGEVTGDGIVSLDDYAKFKNELFPGGASAFAAAMAVPEPASLVLLFTAMLAMIGCRSRRR